MPRTAPFQFGLGSLFGLTLFVALLLGAQRSGGLLEGVAWLPVPMMLGILGVEAAAWAIPKIIELRIRLCGWGRRLFG
jgi:hypothetical protein